MKKFFVLFSLFFTIPTFAQVDLSIGVGTSSIVDFDFQQIYEYKTSYTTVNSYFPFKTGVDLQFRIASNYSIITGYNFLYRYMEVNLYTQTAGNYFNGYKMFTSEVPILFRYDGILKNDNFSFYAELGGSLDYMYSQQDVFGGYKEVLDFIVVARWEYYYIMNLPMGIIPSLQGGVGFQNKIGKNRGTLQFGVNYHYQIPKNISNEFYYYYSSGLGNIAQTNYSFFSRSTYIGVDIKYYLPIKISLKRNEKS